MKEWKYEKESAAAQLRSGIPGAAPEQPTGEPQGGGTDRPDGPYSRRAADINEETPWQALTPGAQIYEPGTSRLFNTGEWRTLRPVFLADRCRHCMLCFPYCPDSAIPAAEGKRLDFDFLHCKGCGICAKVCPFGAIKMEKEGNEDGDQRQTFGQ